MVEFVDIFCDPVRAATYFVLVLALGSLLEMLYLSINPLDFMKLIYS
jgi:hypothetical protein